MRLLGIFYLILVSVFISCNNGTEPTEKDPRFLNWSVDTLHYPNSVQTQMSEFWANSANDVYVIGHCDFSSGRLYHYNGQTWQNIALGGSSGGPVHAPFHLNDLFGFSGSDLYVVGEKDLQGRQSLIVHYNGSEWEEVEVPAKGELFSIWGNTPDDIWAGGNFGTLFHFNGVQWNIDSLPHPGYPDFEFSLNVNEIKGVSSNIMYLNSYSVFPGYIALNHFFKYDNGDFFMVDSTWDPTHELWISPSGKLYKAAIEGTYIWAGSKWEKISDLFQTYGIHGTSDENIFVTGKAFEKYRVMHYNGSDWYEYESLQTESVRYRDIFTIDDEVFVCGYTKGGWPSKTIILNGK